MEIEFKNKDANTVSLVDVKLVSDNAMSMSLFLQRFQEVMAKMVT